MSILKTNLASLEALVEKAKNLPDAGGGSGGVETCTVKVKHTDAQFQQGIIATCYSNGMFSTAFIAADNSSNVEHTIENVVCGGIVAVGHNAGSYLSNPTSAVQLIHTSYLTGCEITAGAGETAVITFRNDK